MMQPPLVIYFYTFPFLWFFLFVFSAYWTLPQASRNLWLLFASYCFYASWDYRFLSLILITTATDYFCGKWMEDYPGKRRLFLFCSIAVNVGQLCLFKYANFFIENAHITLQWLGLGLPLHTLSWVLPLGISYYTFQSLGYTVDIYRGKVKAARDLGTFALFVSFFPQLIAGPIERAEHLLPQLRAKKFFGEIEWKTATYLFLYGVLKKRVLADYLDHIAGLAYDNPHAHGLMIAMGFAAYTVQIYCDISGYADMARGIALFLGIRLSKNFNFPYFASNPVEFWQRWHITLSCWVRLYLFNPLIIRLRKPVLVIFLVFTIMGFWHGPEWHYIQWGIFWASLSVLYQTAAKRFLFPAYSWMASPWVGRPLMALTIVLGQAFFRDQSLAHYGGMIRRLFQPWGWDGVTGADYAKFSLCVGFLLLYELYLFRKNDELHALKLGFYSQTTLYAFMFFLYRNIGNTAAVDFIYFQF